MGLFDFMKGNGAGGSQQSSSTPPSGKLSQNTNNNVVVDDPTQDDGFMQGLYSHNPQLGADLQSMSELEQQLSQPVQNFINPQTVNNSSSNTSNDYSNANTPNNTFNNVAQPSIVDNNNVGTFVNNQSSFFNGINPNTFNQNNSSNPLDNRIEPFQNNTEQSLTNTNLPLDNFAGDNNAIKPFTPPFQSQNNQFTQPQNTFVAPSIYNQTTTSSTELNTGNNLPSISNQPEQETNADDTSDEILVDEFTDHLDALDDKYPTGELNSPINQESTQDLNLTLSQNKLPSVIVPDFLNNNIAQKSFGNDSSLNDNDFSNPIIPVIPVQTDSDEVEIIGNNDLTSGSSDTDQTVVESFGDMELLEENNNLKTDQVSQTEQIEITQNINSESSSFDIEEKEDESFIDDISSDSEISDVKSDSIIDDSLNYVNEVDSNKAEEIKPHNSENVKYSEKNEMFFKKIAFLGLDGNQFDTTLSNTIRTLSKQLFKQKVEIILDTISGLATQVVQSNSDMKNKVTHISLKPLLSDNQSTVKSQGGITTTVVYSNLLEWIRHIVKDSRMFVVVDGGGLDNMALLILLLTISSKYEGQDKPIILLGSGWYTKVDKISELVGRGELNKDNLYFAQNEMEVMDILNNLSNDYNNNNNMLQVPRVVDRRVEGDEMDFIIF